MLGQLRAAGRTAGEGSASIRSELDVPLGERSRAPYCRAMPDQPPVHREGHRRRTAIAPTMLPDGASPRDRNARASSTARSTWTDAGSPPRTGWLDTYRELHEHHGAMAWIGLYRPDRQELASLAEEFELHDLAVEDAIMAHQRPKLERYGDTLFVVLRAARYLDAREEVEFGEVHLFVGPDFVVTVRHSEAPDLAAGPPPAGVRPGSAAAGAGGGPLRHPGPGRRRLRAGRRGPVQRHRRDRDRGLRAATRRFPGASTSCPARSSSSSVPPSRCSACCTR